MIETERLARLEIEHLTQLEDWLEANHQQPDSVWLVTYKKSAPEKYVGRWDVLDVLLCYGWIDGLRRVMDADRTMQLISPRKQQAWARSYKERAARLIAAGRIKPAGIKAIEDSRRLGLWNISDPVDDLDIPGDLHDAFSAHPGAMNWFAAAAPSYRRNVLRWLQSAVKAETRRRRIEKLAQFSARGEKIPNY
jgi:uncharacterized protein YdeI (YjbR/CyaY-like superfamily)